MIPKLDHLAKIGSVNFYLSFEYKKLWKYRNTDQVWEREGWGFIILIYEESLLLSSVSFCKTGVDQTSKLSLHLFWNTIYMWDISPQTAELTNNNQYTGIVLFCKMYVECI